MTYLIAQLCGIGATVCSLGPLLKKKWMMLINSIVANILVATNLILLGQIGSAVCMNFVAIIQISLSLWHIVKEKPVTKTENIIFMIIFIGFGLIGYKQIMDIMPLIGAVFFVLSVFARSEQKTRIFAIANGAVYMVYFGILGSTSAFAQVLSIIMNSVGLYAYTN